jgi:uncharacterized membrane protein
MSAAQQPVALATSVSAASTSRPRLDSIDVLRGLVMVIMALDHARGFYSNITFYPLDLDKTNVALFLTRWITHFCAPVFVFLAGTGAFLSTGRGKSTKELSWFLLTRGLWLVFLELTVIHCFGWTISLDFHHLGAGVIWAIGWSMVVMAALVHLPVWAITAFGLAMVVGHNALDRITPEQFGAWSPLWKLLHVQGYFEYAKGFGFGVGYPLIPWIGVMAAGYGFGQLFRMETSARRRWLLGLGIAMTLLFVVLRGTGVYGDPDKWPAQKNALWESFAFIHTRKYPPSLCYLLMTLGPAFLLLAALDRGTPRWLKPVLVFGRVPLFYYLLHIPLINISSQLVKRVFLGPPAGPPPVPGQPGPPYGFDLPIVYLAWICIVLLLYPACQWFAELKRRRREAWLSYL